MTDDDVLIPIATPTAPRTAALICALVPFVFSYGESHTVTENGVVILDVHRDYVALGGGSLAILLGGLALFFATRRTSEKSRELGLAALAILAGVFQVVVRSGLVL